MNNKVLINYADITHSEAQRRNCDSGRIHGGFNFIHPYGKCDIDKKFLNKHKDILSQRTGAGYWLWKPYIILDAILNDCQDQDFLFYSDAGAEWISLVDPLCRIMESENIDILLFHTDPVPGNEERMCTKRDAFILMDCDGDKYTRGLPLHAGFQMYRKSFVSIAFIEKYLLYCCDPRILTDQPNECGFDNYHGFKFHRHDQSVLSLLAKKEGLKTFRDPTQYGNPYIQPSEVLLGYEQLINHTRKFD